MRSRTGGPATLDRRELLERLAKAGVLAGIAAGAGACTATGLDSGAGTLLNDRQSRLNATRVARVEKPRSLADVQEILHRARKQGRCLSVAGGRHAMGGQQFAEDSVHLDTTEFNQVLALDEQRGLVTVQGGIQWPELIEELHRRQPGPGVAWSIRQKQTGVDRVSIAGTLSANAHGRGLTVPPIVGDVESLVLVGADGEPRRCSRDENRELFALAIGGYGLFGVIAEATLRLVPRRPVERVVEVIEVRELPDKIARRIADGFLFGDCQYSMDFHPSEAHHQGVFSCYRPVAEPPPAEGQAKLSAEDWNELIYLAHTDKAKGFAAYAAHYLRTNGQRYWSDTHQMSNNFDGYHDVLDKRVHAAVSGSEMITEVYVKRSDLVEFLTQAKQLVQAHGIDLIYGTIRFIEHDDTSFLAWARESSACVLCNVHVDHSPAGIDKAAADTRRLIDCALRFGGRYYLTYHHWATRPQLEAAYPSFVEFLRLKRKYDPELCFESEWHRFYTKMFADALTT